MGEKWMLPIYVKRGQIGAMIYCRLSLSLPEPIAVRPFLTSPFLGGGVKKSIPEEESREARRCIYHRCTFERRGRGRRRKEEEEGFATWHGIHGIVGSFFFLFLPLPLALPSSQAPVSPPSQPAAAERGPGGRHRRLLSATPLRPETGEMEGFEFFQIILDNSSSRLRLPDKFTRVLLDGGKPQEVKLREAGHGRRFWDVKVVLDADGHMYLGRGWEQFARAHDLRLGYFLVFSFDGDAVLTVKVFDVSMCRRHYQHDGDTSSGSSSDGDSGSSNASDGGSGGNNWSLAEMDVEDGPTGQFSAMLRKCNLGMKQEQYLNVPVDFQLAHGYAERSKVELRMRGKSWLVHLKHNPKTGGRPRASFRYGWHQFCVDNALGEGDTCFFRALRQGSAGGGGEDHLLKVEVRRRDGSFLV
ncbi:unnamed protein product [Triticum turgidum subsp. durum]|uniref:TF-B3 domain-containing protein n=2 Tax=Triticum TaxID=4564 RepID=A0A9R0S3J0_TRITD|nr:unnamed protein product [Triticum turgidum subsp. durum]